MTNSPTGHRQGDHLVYYLLCTRLTNVEVRAKRADWEVPVFIYFPLQTGCELHVHGT